jgi:hypothetical protein
MKKTRTRLYKAEMEQERIVQEEQSVIKAEKPEDRRYRMMATEKPGRFFFR